MDKVIRVAGVKLFRYAAEVNRCHYFSSDGRAWYHLAIGPDTGKWVENGSVLEAVEKLLKSETAVFDRDAYLILHKHSPIIKQLLKSNKLDDPEFDEGSAEAALSSMLIELPQVEEELP